MSDPLSVSAAIVGLVSVSAHVSQKLIRFIKHTKNAPTQAQSVLAEVRDLEGIICHCKELILGTENINCPGASVVLVKHVVVILSGCVMTFSELEEVLEGLNTEEDLQMFDCVKWARKESKIALIIGRLQNHKASLTAMLTILGCTNQLEAKQSLNHLNKLVEQLVNANQDLSGRMRDIELRQSIQPDDDSVSAPPDALHVLDAQFDTMSIGETSVKDANEERALYQKLEAAFQQDLESSRVYRRAWKDNDHMSQISDATRATPWSILSGLSLAEVSAVSVIALPIFSSEIMNSQHCYFSNTLDEQINGRQGSGLDSLLQPTSKLCLFDVINGEGKRLLESVLRESKYLRHLTDFSYRYGWSKSFLDKWSPTVGLIIDALESTAFQAMSRPLGVNGLRSLERAIEQVFDHLLSVFCDLHLSHNMIKTSGSLTRFQWRLYHREGMERQLLSTLYRACESLAAVQMLLDILHNCSIEEERDIDFRIEPDSSSPDYLKGFPANLLPDKTWFTLVEDEGETSRVRKSRQIQASSLPDLCVLRRKQLSRIDFLGVEMRS